mmetsp:Transcript_3297/g.7131  ORF Transcript_3297/g.7131 Transcript_3297/m.7131 type:complete len:709 (-) Transcript_3297:714-2840(-)
MGCTVSAPLQTVELAGKQNLDGSPSEIDFIANIGEYGSYKFKGDVAAPFLEAVGLPANTLDGTAWQEDKAKADLVAKAVMTWAKSKGATMYTHWFQPLGSAGVRRGQTGQVHNSMFNFNQANKLEWVFSGSELLKGETDGSSYMNGGLRATHTAGGYTALDPSSPMFVRNDTLFIPTIFISFYGKALDEKTPLLRAMQAVSSSGCKLLSKFNYNCASVAPMIGLEQEFFLIPREAYLKRMDLQLAGRTVMGNFPARGQEMSDHYMSALNTSALAFMREMQHECFKMGIPLNTRHREVAPNQYEVAPYFGIATAQIDENLMVMELMEEIAAKHGLAALLHEKPFKGINGSGKHNNFSLGCDTGLNLFNGPQVSAATGTSEAFPCIMAATVRAVHKYPDLLRHVIAAPGNDFRLGAMEAPPSIISTYLGEALTNYLKGVQETKSAGVYAPEKKTVDPAPGKVAPFTVPAEDRNRTSPFPYGGHRFEFRAVGSSQNVSMVNTVLCAAIAEQFEDMCKQMDAGKKPLDIAAEYIGESWPTVFNGNGYGADWPVEAGKRGLHIQNSNPEAIQDLIRPKNIQLFASLGVMTKDETEARCDAMHASYYGMVEIEVKCMIEMVKTMAIPATKAAGISTSKMEGGLTQLEEGLHTMENAGSAYEMSKAARVVRLETMEELRDACDEAESKVPAGTWPIASYMSLLFLDFTEKYKIPM